MDEFDDPEIAAMLAGAPTPKAQVRADTLRTRKPTVTSSSITQTVSGPTQAPKPPSSLRESSVVHAQGALPGLYAEQEKAMGPQDYSGMQDYARERTASGGKSLLLSLAAQAAGKDYEPMAGAYLKRAMEARQPLKTSTGFITDSGQHIEDAQLRADQRLKQIGAQIARNEQIISSAATAEEKERARQDTLELKREQMAQTAALRQMAAGAAAGNRAGVDQDRRFRGEDRMKNDFEQITKSPREGAQAAQSAQLVLQGAAGRKLSNVEQQALITLFNKFLDPGSVVREGEFDRMAKGMGFGQQVQNWSDKILRGSIITPVMAAEIGRVAQLYERDAMQKIQQQSSEYDTVARGRGYDPNAVITNPAWRSAPAAVSGPPEGAVRVKGAPAPAPAASDAPPAGAVRIKR